MPVVTVFGSSDVQPGDAEYSDGVRLGRLLTEAGFAVATGGYGGLMEAVSSGARQAGGEAIGVTAPPVFPGRKGPNPYVSREVRAASLVERIHELTAIADGAVALPGSIGTFTELMVAWNLAFVAPFSGAEPKPVVAVGATWRELVPMVAERLRTEPLVTCVADVDEAVRVLTVRLGRAEGFTGGGPG